jgi:hypothetical protein
MISWPSYLLLTATLDLSCSSLKTLADGVVDEPNYAG